MHVSFELKRKLFVLLVAIVTEGIHYYFQKVIFRITFQKEITHKTFTQLVYFLLYFLGTSSKDGSSRREQ